MAKRLTADARREGIVKAARKLFATRGYEDTRVEEIAEAAGCTTGPVYHFFGTKRDIYEGAFRAALREAGSTIDRTRAASDGLSPLERLVASCDQLLGLLSYKETIAFTLEAPRVLGVDEYREIFDRGVAFIEDDLRAAMMEGEIEPEPPGPLAVLIGGAIVNSANHVALAGSRAAVAAELDRHREALKRLVLRLSVRASVG